MARGAIVTVLGCKTVSGRASRGFATGPLASALVERWACDAMLQCGYAADGRRIVKRSAPPITMTCVAFDFDPPGHVPDEPWSADAETRLRALVATHSGYAYSTRSGWRWVVQLAAPLELHTHTDWDAWRARYAVACDWLAELGLTADRSCSEPGRLHRLPCVVRDGIRLEPRVIGSVEALGAFELPEAPRSAHAPRPPLAVGPASSQGLPLGVDVEQQQARSPLYRKLAAAGLILGQGDTAGSFRVLCPRRRLHSTGRDGDGSTTLFLPESNGYGVLHCHHNACSGMTTPQWLDALDTGEGAHERRLVRVDGVGIDSAREGVCLSMRVSAADGEAELPLRYLKVYSSTAARWRALFASAGVELPEDLEIGGDLSAACAELRGRLLTLQLEGSTVRMILPAQQGQAA